MAETTKVKDFVEINYTGKLVDGTVFDTTLENIAKDNSKNKMVVISGVGVRGYYFKIGYNLEGPYVVKNL